MHSLYSKPLGQTLREAQPWVLKDGEEVFIDGNIFEVKKEESNYVLVPRGELLVKKEIMQAEQGRVCHDSSHKMVYLGTGHEVEGVMTEIYYCIDCNSTWEEL